MIAATPETRHRLGIIGIVLPEALYTTAGVKAVLNIGEKKSLRDRLKIMAHEKRVTLNQLCRSLLEEAAERLTQTAVEQSGSSSGS
jgi:hypothetical protein